MLAIGGPTLAIRGLYFVNKGSRDNRALCWPSEPQSWLLQSDLIYLICIVVGTICPGALNEHNGNFFFGQLQLY